MRNDERRSPLKEVLQGGLHRALRLSIQAAGRFIQEEERCVAEDRASDGHALQLPTGKRSASLADDVITIVTDTVTGTSNYRTLDELHSHLDPAVFWRVHRSHLVNINKIKEIVPWFSRNYILRMKDGKGTEIPVSRAQTKRFREYLSL